MATKKSTMRLATAVAVIAQAAENHIEHHTAKAGKGRELLYLLSEITNTPVEVSPAAVTPKPTGQRPAPGSLPARILDVIGEIDADTVNLKDIMAGKPGANEAAVRYQLGKLVKAGFVRAYGATSTRRYALPVKKGGK